VRQCPFYRFDTARAPEREPDGPRWPVRWCSHAQSPVSLLVATEAIGSIRKLKCDGDPAKCEIPAEFRPPSWLF